MNVPSGSAVVVVLLLLASCGGGADSPQSEELSFRIDPDRITVSGVSSGAYMAGQMHIAHSGVFAGVGIIAGGPYACAQGELSIALGACLKGGDVNQPVLTEFSRAAEAAGQIDALANLDDDTVWLFHGAKDVIVGAAVVRAAADYYKAVAPGAAITLVEDVEVIHGMPTLETGVECGEFASPFLNACNYDAAGAILNALHGPLAARVAAEGTLRALPQPGYEATEMLPEAFLYVPTSCAGGETCGLHVALHGCQQSSAFVDDAFATGAGYNEWAESNRLLVLYPQVSSSKLMPMNPQGCWDWWGYTGDAYATKEGSQVSAIRAMIDGLTRAGP